MESICKTVTEDYGHIVNVSIAECSQLLIADAV